MEEVQPRMDAIRTRRFPANSRVAPEDLTAVDLQLWADFPTLLCSSVGMNVIGAVLG